MFDNDSATMFLNGQAISLGIWDTAGQSEFDTIRPLSYPQTDVFLICFAVDSPASLQNITAKWLPEITQYCPKVPYLLIGLKSDLRVSSANLGLVSQTQAKDIAHEIDAFCYLECSALTQEGLRQVFDEAARCVIAQVKPKIKSNKGNCTIT